MTPFKALFVLLCVAILFNFGNTKYKIRMISIEKCKLPEERMFRDAPLTYEFSARKVSRDKTVVTSTFNITRREGPVLFAFRGYQLKHNTNKDLVFKLERQSCKNPLTFQLVAALKLKLDKECYALPGKYESNKISPDDFSWLLDKTMVGAGQYAYELEFSTTKGVAACIDLKCDAVEKKS